MRTKRGNKNIAFVALNDGSTVNNIQIVFDMNNFSENDLKPVTTGACIGVKGALVASQGSGQSVEIQAKELEVMEQPTAKHIRFRRRGTVWNFYVR